MMRQQLKRKSISDDEIDIRNRLEDVNKSLAVCCAKHKLRMENWKIINTRLIVIFPFTYEFNNYFKTNAINYFKSILIKEIRRLKYAPETYTYVDIYHIYMQQLCCNINRLQTNKILLHNLLDSFDDLPDMNSLYLDDSLYDSDDDNFTITVPVKKQQKV